MSKESKNPVEVIALLNEKKKQQMNKGKRILLGQDTTKEDQIIERIDQSLSH